jgi:CBS domain containing-hemolysin-like protein
MTTLYFLLLVALLFLNACFVLAEFATTAELLQAIRTSDKTLTE